MQYSKAINPKPDDNLIEIGPGLGALTFPLLEDLKQMSAVELDRDLFAHLKAEVQKKASSPLNLLNEDVLRVDFDQFGKNQRIVGNLPYNISTPVILHLLLKPELIKDMCFMLQKEVVQRMSAQPATKAYGRLSVILQYL